MGRARAGGVSSLLQALAVAKEHDRRKGTATVPRQKLSLPLPRAPAVVGQEPRLGCPRQGRGPEETVRVALDQQVKGRRGSVVVAALHPGLTEVEVCVIA